MRTLTEFSFMVGLALTISTTAGAEWVTLSLVQVGGTYDGVQANAGDTLVLSIQYTVGDQGPTLIDPSITWGAEVASFDGGTETGMAAWSGGSYAMSPIATGDIALISPNLANGWEKSSTVASGAFEPCVFGACTSLGTVSFTLSGQGGVIGFAPEWISFGTVVGYSGGPMICLDPPCWNEIPFTVISGAATAVPSLGPMGAVLLGGLIVAFGLAGIAAGRGRRAAR
jgi:hypothetical protein